MHPGAEIFFLEDYIEERQKTKGISTSTNNVTIDRQEKFDRLCEEIKQYFDKQWEVEYGNNIEQSDELTRLIKNAIIGYPKEVNYFKDKINEYMGKNGLANEWYPPWYENVADAIFHESWGLAGISKWKNQMPESSSAKIIGENIFFLINGKQVLQEQKIKIERVRQLRKALLLRSPEKRFDEEYSEVYMSDGTRITIFESPLVKQPTIIFRKYIIENFTFEEIADKGSIPKVIIPMFKAMVHIGFNVNFVGPVRSGKTTFLQTWQSYEIEELEGVQVETDPEVPLHKLMPRSPIMQIVADGDKLKKITKSLMRSDADYLIMAEARDGIAIKIAVTLANKGTRRVKSTFHTSDPVDFCFDAASEIVSEFGGDLYMSVVKVAKSYNYLFQFIQLKDKSKKRLKSIYEVRYNSNTFEITLHQICKYNIQDDSWTFKNDIGEDKREIGLEEDPEAFKIFQSELKKLSELFPMEGENVIKPYYNHLRGR